MLVGKAIQLSLGIIFVTTQITLAQTILVTGIVKDEKGIPVASASLQVKRTNTGVSTDTAGFFKLQVRPNAILTVTAVGFEDTSINIGNQTSLSLILKHRIRPLAEAVVTGSAPGNTAKQMETMNTQAVGNTISNYRETQNISSGQSIQEGMSGRTAFHDISRVPTGTLYTGASLPVFTHREDTRGSRYLFDKWVSGSVTDSGNNVINNNSYLFNYDKISKKLLLTQDMKSVIEIEKAGIKSFTLKNEGNYVVFECIPLIDNTNFLQSLVKGNDKYSLFKSVKTKFEKSDFHSDGLVESGKPYDEYVDEAEYFVVFPGGKEDKKIIFKQKSIKDVFSSETEKLKSFFSQHRDEPIDETYLIALVLFLNH